MTSKPATMESDIILEDIEIELDEIDFSIVDEIENEYIDDRDYVDSCFQNFARDKGSFKKSIRRKVCNTNKEPEIKDGEIVAIFNYKAQPAKGRKTPLAGYDILHVSMPTGPFRVPLDQAEKFGKYLIMAARAAIKSNQTNDNTEQ